MTRFIILFFSMLAILSAMAQEREHLYLRSDVTVEKLASDIVSAKTSLTEEQKSAFRQAIRDAFTKYWQQNDAKSGIKTRDYQNILKEISELDVMVFSRLALLMKQNQMRQDSITGLRDSLNHPELVDAGISLTDTLTTSLGNDTVRLTNLKAEIAVVEGTLSERRKILVDTLTYWQHLSTQLDSLENELAEINKSTSPETAHLSSLALTEAQLSEAENELDKDVNQIDIKKLADALSLFDANEDVIKSLDQAKYQTLKAKVGKIRPVVSVIKPIQQGMALMAGKYVLSQNKECMALINKEISKKGLDTKWKLLGNEVSAALSRQENSYKNITFILNNIKEQNKDVIKDSFDIDQTISNLVNFVNPGQNRYNKYYANFNRILDVVTNDFTHNKDSINKRGVSVYIDNIMSEL